MITEYFLHYLYSWNICNSQCYMGTCEEGTFSVSRIQSSINIYQLDLPYLIVRTSSSKCRLLILLAISTLWTELPCYPVHKSPLLLYLLVITPISIIKCPYSIGVFFSLNSMLFDIKNELSICIALYCIFVCYTRACPLFSGCSFLK